jgi:hypothetical protein
MIYLPATLTPVPRYPGYFWDVKSHKMFSLKVGGELREMMATPSLERCRAQVHAPRRF